jgi:hypothetical protein
MDDKRSKGVRIAAAVARAGLVISLVGAVWGVYRRVPRPSGGEGARVGGAHEQRGATSLHIRLRRAAPAPPERIPVQLFPVDMTAARNEFDSKRRRGVSFEEFVTPQMGGRRPVTAELDERGEAVVVVPPGRWWVHAALPGEREISWRLPVNVTGREKTVELTEENAYAKAKKF